jgi:hypothetical protein
VGHGGKCVEGLAEKGFVGIGGETAFADDVIFRGNLEQIDFVAMLETGFVDDVAPGKADSVWVCVVHFHEWVIGRVEGER